MTSSDDRKSERQIIPLAPISLRDVLFVFFSKKRVFIHIWLLVVGGTLAVALGSDPVYEVSAQILVKPYVEPSLQYDSAPRILRPNPVTQEDVNSEIGILLSDELLRTVVKKLKLDAKGPPPTWMARILGTIRGSIKAVMIFLGLSVPTDPLDVAVASLRGSLSVKPLTMSNLFEVTLEGGNPQKITKIVNTLVDSYIDQHISVHQSQGGEAFFAKQADFYERKMTAAEAAVKEFQSKWSVGDIAIHRAGLMNVLRTLNETLALARGKIADFSTRLEEAKNKEGIFNSQSTPNLLIVELTKALTPLLVEQSRIAELYQPTSLELNDISKQVEEIQKKSRKNNTGCFKKPIRISKD